MPNLILTHSTGSGIVTRGGFLKVLTTAMLWPWMGRFRLLAAVEDNSAVFFRRHLNTVFLVRSDSGTEVAFRLAAVIERPRTDHIEQFSLMFAAPHGTPDLHGTRAFEHRALGRFDVFIVPIGATAAHPVVYEACFSRTVTSVATC